MFIRFKPDLTSPCNRKDKTNSQYLADGAVRDLEADGYDGELDDLADQQRLNHSRCRFADGA